MNKAEVTIKNKTTVIEFPGSWNELSADQVKFIASLWEEIRVAIRSYPAGIDYYRAKVIMYLAGFKYPRFQQFYSRKCRAVLAMFPTRSEVRFNGNNEEFFDQYEHLFDVLALTDFIFIDPLALTQNRFPSINSKFGKLQGPANEYAGICFKEFVFVDTLFGAYLRTRSEHALDELIAIMYRPAVKVKVTDINYKGDMRAHFNSNAIDAWKPAVQKLPTWFRQYCVMFYQSCRQKWEQDYPEVFSTAEEETYSVSDWFTIMSELPSGKFGTFTERENTSADTVLMELNRVIKKAKPNVTN
jgi:hypothetical protein